MELAAHLRRKCNKPNSHSITQLLVEAIRRISNYTVTPINRSHGRIHQGTKRKRIIREFQKEPSRYTHTRTLCRTSITNRYILGIIPDNRPKNQTISRIRGIRLQHNKLLRTGKDSLRKIRRKNSYISGRIRTKKPIQANKFNDNSERNR